ncbi:MAG: hypothetical protein RL417_215, partial [Pseudomonadota bacterium]
MGSAREPLESLCASEVLRAALLRAIS